MITLGKQIIERIILYLYVRVHRRGILEHRTNAVEFPNCGSQGSGVLTFHGWWSIRAQVWANIAQTPAAHG